MAARAAVCHVRSARVPVQRHRRRIPSASSLGLHYLYQGAAADPPHPPYKAPDQVRPRYKAVTLHKLDARLHDGLSHLSAKPSSQTASAVSANTRPAPVAASMVAASCKHSSQSWPGSPSSHAPTSVQKVSSASDPKNAAAKYRHSSCVSRPSSCQSAGMGASVGLGVVGEGVGAGVGEAVGPGVVAAGVGEAVGSGGGGRSGNGGNEGGGGEAGMAAVPMRTVSTVMLSTTTRAGPNADANALLVIALPRASSSVPRKADALVTPGNATLNRRIWSWSSASTAPASAGAKATSSAGTSAASASRAIYCEMIWLLNADMEARAGNAALKATICWKSPSLKAGLKGGGGDSGIGGGGLQSRLRFLSPLHKQQPQAKDIYIFVHSKASRVPGNLTSAAETVAGVRGCNMRVGQEE